MKWEKLGQIFSCEQYGLYYAKSPQAVVLDDRVRVYFTPCKQDGDKLIAYAMYADFDKTFAHVLYVSDQLLPDGGLGCFDEHGIFPFSPTPLPDGRVYAYTSGVSRRRAVSVEAGIGLAVSEDGGATFTRYGRGPVLTALRGEPHLVIDAFTRVFDGLFHMWYIRGVEWKRFAEDGVPERIYRVAHATSKNGVDWEREGTLILPTRVEDESQALPTVIEADGRYHMMFCYRHSYDFRRDNARSYRLGYAVSDDLLHWTRDDSLAGIDVSPDGWDSGMQCYPNLFRMDGDIFLLYNGNSFGKYGFGLAKLKSR